MALLPDNQPKDAPEKQSDALNSEIAQRLRTGIGGILAVVLAVGVAQVLMSRALQNEETAVPEAAPTVEPSATQGSSDPLSDAGVVPDLPAQPEDEPIPEGPVLPEKGEGAPIE